MSVVAFAAGILSLLAPLTFTLLPLSILAIAIGGVVLWRVSRDGSRGTWLAQLGLGLGVLSATWSVTATAGETQHLVTRGGACAKLYLDYLSSGRTYDALELRLPIRERQIAGTDLEAYYLQRAGEPADRTYEVVNSSATKIAMAAGEQADWQLVRGVKIEANGSQKMITVEMANATEQGQRIQLLLRRQIYQDDSGSHAMWLVQDAYPVDASGNRI
jgi:hypothetical protein